MLVIQAPYPMLTATMIMPNPELQDTQALPMHINYIKSMNNNKFTYAKFNDTTERILNWTFSDIQRVKIVEFFNFYTDYPDSYWKITDWLGTVWKLIILENTIPYSFTGKGGLCYDGLKETGTFRLTLRGSAYDQVTPVPETN